MRKFILTEPTVQNYFNELFYISDVMTMNIAKRTIPIVTSGYVIDAALPVIPFSSEVTESQCSEIHAHPRAQLIYSSTGTMQVKVKDKMWLVTSRQAIWVPPMFEHQVFYLNPNSIRNVFIDPSAAVNLPAECFALDVSPFLRELLLKVVQIGTNYSQPSLHYRLIQVLLDELMEIKPTKCFLPISDSPVLKNITDVLIEDPANDTGLEKFAEMNYTTTRTLSRMFSKELGVSFRGWRKQVRLMQAVISLEKGEPIAKIAYELGYNSPSAFIEMFRKYYGAPPGKFFSQVEGK